MAGSRAGVVTTVKDFQALADSWCTYHLAVGFEHLYVYFDDPAELDAVGLPSRFPAERLTCIPHDAKLRAEWKKLQMHGAKGSADEYVAYAKNEVQTRQQLNARHAVKLAHARGLDWLLHVDADELFYPGPSGDARAHFASLSTAGAATFCYMNHEAVPETHGIVDPFKEVSLFKRSLELCQPTPEAQEAVGFWQRLRRRFERTTAWWGHARVASVAPSPSPAPQFSAGSAGRAGQGRQGRHSRPARQPLPGKAKG